MQPIISFVMPVYNNEKYFPIAVNSILQQKSDSKIELVIVDDGSTDNTGKIADSFKKIDNRVKVIHQDNQWIYASMNNGIIEAEGEYIYILNSDDKLVDGAISEMLQKIDKYNHSDVIWTKTKWCYVDENQNIISSLDVSSNAEKDSFYGSVKEVRDNWNYIESCLLTMDQANLYKRSLMINHPFRNDVYSADTLFNYSIANEINSMAVIKDVVYMHMIYQSSDRNISKGKYYPYMHDMFNEIYYNAKAIYDEWDISENIYMPFLVDRRLKQLTEEVVAYAYSTCDLEIEEKIIRIFGQSADKNVREAAKKVGREREYESRILNGCKKILCDTKIDGKLKFVDTLLSGLPKNHLDNVNHDLIDEKQIDEAIHDPLNFDKIGEIYYKQDW